MPSFYEKALRADETEMWETLNGFVSPDGSGSFEAVLSALADLAKDEGDQAAFTDSPTDKLGENLLNLEGKIREAFELARLLGL